jgi:hypothetical protein
MKYTGTRSSSLNKPRANIAGTWTHEPLHKRRKAYPCDDEHSLPVRAKYSPPALGFLLSYSPARRHQEIT